MSSSIPSSPGLFPSSTGASGPGSPASPFLSFVQQDSQSPPLPASPALNPVSPRGFSNISSLASSLEMAYPFKLTSTPARPPDEADAPSGPPAEPRNSEAVLASSSSVEEQDVRMVHSETQALMQMLSMVGSRFFEAEGQGVMEDEDDMEEHGLHEPIDEERSEKGTWRQPRRGQKTQVTEPESSSQPASRHRHLRPEKTWLSGNRDVFDESATPLGGRTPLAASTTSLHRGKKLAGGSFGIASEAGQKRPQAQVRRFEESPAGQSGTRHPFSEASIDTGEEGDSEDSGTDGDNLAQEDRRGSVSIKRTDSSNDQADLNAGAADPTSTSDPRSSPVPQSPGLQDPIAIDDDTACQDNEAQLLAQLRRLFDLEPSEELISTHRCWLFRSILLQGHVYLTSGHLCFYAYLPSKENRLLRSGPIGKLTRRTHRFSKHWATLKGGLLSWYDSERDPYFPQGFIDLRRVSAVESSSKHSDRFKLMTPYRRFVFQVDSEASRNAWVGSLRKEVFKAHNEGESVKISIPLETLVDVDTTISVDQTEMVCVKVVDEQAGFAIDEYFFLHLSRRDEFLRAIRRTAFDNNRPASDALRWSRSSIQDSTSAMVNTITLPASSLDEVPVLPMASSLKRQGSSASTKTMSSPRSHTDASHGARAPIAIVRKDKLGPRSGSGDADADRDQLSSTPTARTENQASVGMSYIYPPSPSFTNPPPTFQQVQKEVERGWAVPKWIKDTPVKVLGNNTAAETLSGWMGGRASRREHRRIIELWPKDPAYTASPTNDDGPATEPSEDLSGSGYSSFSVLDAPDEEQELATEDGRVERQFQETFGLPPDERLLGHVHATLFRVLPITGRAFISTNFLAFRSSGIAQKTVGRTLMLMPLADIVSAARQPSFRYGQHGVVVTVRGYEEVFLELSSSERREEMLSLLEVQLDRCKADGSGNDEVVAADASERSSALILRDLSEQIDRGFDSVSASSSTLSTQLSALDRSTSMLRSDSSALLSFKPTQPLTFTMLTIGSRGDVQPYIALGKGLQADGHRVRIATHPEFEDWVRGHGIEFSGIGGDPAELMRICVENGTFTVSFLREGVTKFRGWLDDLLLSSWKACQGSDIIVESPSAIAGLHIAEALQVPYFRAFTMPWTRTRVFPHAFAVPGSKAGGNYNYMSYVIFDQIFWRAAAGQINRWRKRHLGLRSTTFDKLEQHKVPFIYNFSPSLVPRPLDWFEWIHVTGFWFLDNPDNSASRKWQPPEDLVAFIDRARATGRKLVYIGWGSIVVSDAEAMTRCVLEAVKKSGVCAIISKGWSDRLSSGKDGAAAPKPIDPSLLEDVYQVASVPHDWLFPLIDAACHHGGAGTLGASLRAGLPTIVKPYFGDQFFWGQQVESLGVGSCVKNLTVDALAAALKSATTNTRQIEKARALGAQIRAEDGVGEAIKAIYRDLDYARSRIKRDTRLATPTKGPSAPDPTASRADDVAADPHSTPLLRQQAAAPRAATDATAGEFITASTVPDAVDVSRDHSTCSADHTSDEWSDVGAPWSPSISGSQDDPSSSLLLPTDDNEPRL